MNKRYVISIDCGTQSLRVLVFDNEGTLIFKNKSLIDEYVSLNVGWKEIDPDIIWEKICVGLLELKEKRPEIHDLIEGVTISCQRDSVIIVDHQGKPLRKCISWMDKRQSKKIKPMAFWANLLLRAVKFKRIGDTFNREFKLNWIIENEPELWRKAYKYFFLSTYLNYRLTGEFKDSTASTIGHIPFDYKKFKWSTKMDIKRQIFQIENQYLYELVKPCSLMGNVTKAASDETGLKKGLSVIASGSDKGCETIGVGCNNLTRGSISLGSQATIQTVSEKYFEIVPLFPPFPSIKYGWYNPEITISRGYWMVKWFEDEFAHEELIEAKGNSEEAIKLLNSKVEKIPPGCDGLILQPFWGQELLRPEAKGSIIGFHDGHGKAHLYRAIIEGIGFALLEGTQRLEKRSGVKMEKIALSGGGSQSDVICQITADIFNREVYKVQTYETTGLGAAAASFVGLGIYRDIDEAVGKMVHEDKIFVPNQQSAFIYERLYKEVYQKMFHRLRPLYKALNKIDQSLLPYKNLEKKVNQ